MKKGTRIVAVGMCLAMFGAFAMGSGSSSEDTKKEIVASDDVASGEDASEDGASEDVSGDNETAPKQDISIEEQVLMDQDGIKVTALEYTVDSIWGDSVKLMVENNSDKDYTVTCDALIVNDFMISDLFITEVAAGKKANETLNLSSSELEAAGIDNVGKIEIYFRAHDENYDTLFENVHAEIKTSAYDSMDTTVDDAGTELYNENGIRIVGKTVDENSFWGTAILLYIENTAGKNVGISVDDMSINGFMLSPFFSTTVYDGKKSVDEITIFSSDLEENNITSIDEVELKFHLYNADSYDTIADSEPITFKAK